MLFALFVTTTVGLAIFGGKNEKGFLGQLGTAADCESEQSTAQFRAVVNRVQGLAAAKS